MVVCKDRLERLSADERMGVEAAAAVESDIAALLSGKTYEQLGSLQRQIQGKLTSGEPVDTDYWESLLKKILVWKAKSKLKNLHEVVLRNRLEQLRKKQRDEALHAQQELLAGVTENAPATTSDIQGSNEQDVEEQEPYDRAMSPPLLDITRLSEEERQLDIVTAKEYLRALVGLIRSSVNG